MTVVQELVTSEKDSTPKTPQCPTVLPSPNTIAATPREVATMRKTKNAELRRMVENRKAQLQQARAKRLTEATPSRTSVSKVVT